MAQLLATTYSGLIDLHKVDTDNGGFRVGKWDRKIGNNTTSVAETDGVTGQGRFIISLHGHQIVKLTAPTHWKDGEVSFTLAGWNTMTTRDRVNQFLPQHWGVHTSRCQAYLTHALREWENDYLVTRFHDTMAIAHNRWYTISPTVFAQQEHP